MIDSRKFRSSVRRTGLSMTMAMAAAGVIWTLCLADRAGAQSGFNGSSHAIRPSAHRPVARVIAVSGSASVHWNGRSCPLAAGRDLGAGEVIVTGVHSTVLVGTADGGDYWIFPESRVKFRENRRMWLDQVDRCLNGIRTHIQCFGGPPSSNRLSGPSAVMAVRAAALPSTVRGGADFEKSCIEMRRGV
jgi:hypothetical protein